MEVLAHIGAPSGKRDDDRYEAQARAYAEFQPLHLINLSRHLDNVSFSTDEEETANLLEATCEQSPDFIDDTQLAIAGLQTDLLTKSLRKRLNNDSQRYTSSDKVALTDEYARGSLSQDLSRSSVGSLPSQRYQDNANFYFSSHTNSRRHQAPYMAIREGNSFGVAFIGVSKSTKNAARQPVCPSWPSQQKGEDLLSSRSSHYKAMSSPDARHLLRSQDVSFKRLPNQVEPGMSDKKEEATRDLLPNAESRENQQRVSKERSMVADGKGKMPIEQTSPDESTQLRDQEQSRFIKEAEGSSIDFRDQSYDFTVQNPPVGTSKEIPSQLNDAATTLKKLPTIPALQDRFNPVERVRELGQYERAKWTVDTSQWPTKAQLKFWEWLQDHGKDGRLGWNITFWREHDKDADENTIRNSLGTVTVFCWPEVIEHIYLALYVASRSRIAGSGATLTTGARGELILRMP